VENPEEVVKVGEEIEVKILRVDTEERKIGLSRKRVEWAEEDRAARQKREGGREKTHRADLKGGLGQAGPLIAPIAPAEAETAAADQETPGEDSDETSD